MTELKANLDKLLKFLEEENCWVKNFSVNTVGNYRPDDAIWNYKDTPHLNVVHSLAMGCQALLSDNHVAALHTQKIMGIKFPMTLVEYQVAQNELVYFSTILLFTVLVNTKVNFFNNQTCVTTTYYLAGPWFTRPIFYFLKKLVLNNYKTLMSEDIPMRNRKAELRAVGYSFAHDNSEHSWIQSVKIGQNNVIPPLTHRTINIDLLGEFGVDGDYLFGDNGIHGFRILKKGDQFTLYPRLCLHEGACLDNQKPNDKGVILCPWHARNILPLAVFDINLPKLDLITSNFLISKNGLKLCVSIKGGFKDEVQR